MSTKLGLASEAPDLPPGTLIAATADGIDVAARDGIVRLLELQLPNGKVMDAKAFVNGNKEWLTPKQCRFE